MKYAIIASRVDMMNLVVGIKSMLQQNPDAEWSVVDGRALVRAGCTMLKCQPKAFYLEELSAEVGSIDIALNLIPEEQRIYTNPKWLSLVQRLDVLKDLIERIKSYETIARRQYLQAQGLSGASPTAESGINVAGNGSPTSADGSIAAEYTANARGPAEVALHSGPDSGGDVKAGS